MTWQKVSEKNIRRRIPLCIASVYTKRRKISFNAACKKSFGLARYKTVVLLYDDKSKLMACQFHKDDDGDLLLFHKDSGTVLSCQAVLKRLDVQPGKYLAKQDREGFIVIDFTHQVPEKFLSGKRI